MGYIYKIVNNISNKIYVGKSIRDPYTRIQEHFSDYELLMYDTKLTRAILKYPDDSWSWDIIEECDDSILSDREIYWIDKLGSYKNGYNSTLGGDGNSRYNFDKENIKQQYLSGLSCTRIAKEIGCHPYYIGRILAEFGIDVSNNQSKPKAIACFDRYKQLIKIFRNKKEIHEYLMEYGYGHYINNVYHTVSKACITGELKYKRYWVEVDDSNKSMLTALNCCGIHERYGERHPEVLAHYRKSRKIAKNCRCEVCGSIIKDNTDSKLCRSCSQVKAKGKVNKPSKHELEQLLNQGIMVKDIALMYGRSGSTVSTWIKNYGIIH